LLSLNFTFPHNALKSLNYVIAFLQHVAVDLTNVL